MITMAESNSSKTIKIGRGPIRNMNIEKPTDLKKTAYRICRYFKTHIPAIVFLVISVCVTSLCAVLAPKLQSDAIDAITNGEYSSVGSILIFMLLIYGLSALSTTFQNLSGAYLSKSIVKDIREDLFNKVVYLPIKYLDSHRHGDIMSRMTNDVENISNVIAQSLSGIVSGALTISGTVIMMVVLCPQLALLSCSTIILTIIATSVLSKFMRKYYLMKQKLLGTVNTVVEEKVSGYKTVTAYNMQEDVIEEFQNKSDELTKVGIIAEVLGGSMGPVMNCINNIGFVIIAAFGGYFAFKGMISVGVISAFIVYAKQFGRPINEIAQVYGQIQTALAGAERIFEILDEPSEFQNGDKSMDNIQGVIEFKNVNFSYTPGKRVLKNFSLEVRAGHKVALVGATGSGKTTVVNLLMDFYDIDSGSITIDGVNIKDYSLKSLRDSIAIVLQDTVLFTDTIRNNLKYADENATDDIVIKSAKLSNCYEMINKLPEGLDTILTEQGKNISQGQRQLISIGRAFVSQPKILILDEATSSVDTRTEKHIQDAMVNLMKNRTSLIIAHRLSTIRDADVIVVMDKGEISEIGNHDELIAKKGKYYELYMTQFEGNTI